MLFFSSTIAFVSSSIIILSSIPQLNTQILSLFFKVIIDPVIIKIDHIIENIIQFPKNIHSLKVLNPFIIYAEFSDNKKQKIDKISIMLQSFIEILKIFFIIKVFLLAIISQSDNMYKNTKIYQVIQSTCIKILQFIKLSTLSTQFKNNEIIQIIIPKKEIFCAKVKFRPENFIKPITFNNVLLSFLFFALSLYDIS
jgi:hypothetical protein